MSLPRSGPISLNQIHVAAGDTSGTTCSLNDSNIRNLIDKASGAELTFDDWHFYLNNSVADAESPWYQQGLTQLIDQSSGSRIVFKSNGSVTRTTPDNSAGTASAGYWGSPQHVDAGNDYEIKFTYEVPTDFYQNEVAVVGPDSGDWTRLNNDVTLALYGTGTYIDNSDFLFEGTMTVDWSIRERNTTFVLSNNDVDLKVKWDPYQNT